MLFVVPHSLFREGSEIPSLHHCSSTMSGSYDDQDASSGGQLVEGGYGAISQLRGPKRHRIRSNGDLGTFDSEPLRSNDALSRDADTTLDRIETQHGHVASVFLQKTFVMINECDPKICSWSQDGETFIVKDRDILARDVIPKYFGHNKFASFSRQLNFYGFRKMQSKPIRNIDMDPETAQYLTFVNDNFKRGREDLLVRIQRSTRGAAAMNNHANTAVTTDQDSEVQRLKQKVESLEEQMREMAEEYKRKFLNLETSFASMLQISSEQIQHRTTHGLHPHAYNHDSSNPSFSFPSGTHQYPPNAQHPSMYQMENDTKAAKDSTRNVSYFGDLSHLEEFEFQDFFI